MLSKRLENIYCQCHSPLHQKSSSGKRGNAGAMLTPWISVYSGDRQAMASHMYYNLFPRVELQNLNSCTDRINPHC